MSADKLAQATQALRLARTGATPTPNVSEDRIVSLAGRRSRRARRLFLVLPVAAVLAVSSAWAASHTALGWRTRAAWMRLMAPATQMPRAPQPSAARVAARPPEVELHAPEAPETVAPAPIDPHTAEPPALEASKQAPRISVSSHPASSSQAVVPIPAAPVAATASPLELYQRAHALHFRGHDPAAALAAWNTYLAAAPSGPLALEARYNRAICLVQLGRSDEAREALSPFARGDYGGYRQAEAAAILTGTANP